MHASTIQSPHTGQRNCVLSLAMSASNTGVASTRPIVTALAGVASALGPNVVVSRVVI